MEADRKIPAVKLFISQLDRARQPANSTDAALIGDMNLVGLALLELEFTRVWLQVRHRASYRTKQPAHRKSSATCLLPLVAMLWWSEICLLCDYYSVTLLSHCAHISSSALGCAGWSSCSFVLSFE